MDLKPNKRSSALKSVDNSGSDYLHVLYGSVSLIGLHFSNLLDNSHAFGHPSEYGVFAVQVLGRRQCYEELTAISVGPGVGHT